MCTEQKARIRRMEGYMLALQCALRHAPARLEQATLGQMHAALAQYYDGGLFLQDYTADEAGLLPDDLPRSVLSQDGLYDLLCALQQRKKEEEP